MSELTIGEKIKQFRKRAGMSQLELESLSGASTGSISRIETNQINPTKETILSISKALQLISEETASLFGLDFISSLTIIDIVNKVNEHLDIEKIMQVAVNEIGVKLNYRNVSIFLIIGENLYGRYMNENENSTNSIRLIGKPFNELFVPLKASTSLFVRCVKEKKVFQSNRLNDFGMNAVEESTGDYIQKATKINYSIAVPLVTNDECIGCIFFAKEEALSYNEELPLIEGLAKNIARQMYNSIVLKSRKKIKKIKKD